MESLAASVERQTFDVARRGYDRGQVDRFLAEAAASIASLEETMRDALIQKRELERRRAGTREVQDSVESAYVAAAEAKHKLLSDAEQRAALMLRDAEIEVARLLADPKAASEQARRDAESVLLQAQNRLEAASIEAEAMRADAERALEAAAENSKQVIAAARDEAGKVVREAEATRDEIVETAHRDADEVLADARRRASEVYEDERRRSIERFAHSRDEYERLARALRDLQEATGDMLTNALRDHESIRLVLDDSTLEVG